MARMIDTDRLPIKSWKKTAVAFQDDYTAGAGTDWTLQVATAENRMLWEIISAIENAPTLTPPNEWVSVEERLPAPTENLVLVYDCTGVNMAWYSYAMGWKYRTGLPGVEITHWMPLPEPPKEETP